MKDSTSFARQLSRILDVRTRYGIATATQLDVPSVSHKGLLVLVHQLGNGSISATVLNFTGDEIHATVQSKHLTGGATVVDLFTDQDIAVVDELGSFPMTLQPYQGVPVMLRG